MFEERTYKQTFFSAPQSVTSLIAALLEPTLAALTLVAAHVVYDVPVRRPSFTLSLLVFALMFPGRNRFRDGPLVTATDIATSWLSLLALFAFCGYATRSFVYFDYDVLAAWAIATPLLQFAAAQLGGRVLRLQAARALSRRGVIVVGAGPLGVKVAAALTRRKDEGVDFLGYFDDRSGERIHPGAAPQLRGRLGDVAGHILQHGVREVYITLPLGSQPRIVSLLESVQDTTASLFFVPDVFGISIIQGRLQDVHGVPVVGICETPFTGTNDLVKRTSDIILASLILVLVSPLLLAIAIGVKRSSPGPIIFKQRRNGLDGEEIIVWKFRTMTVEENGAVVRQAVRADPRITRFGAILRRTSLDELPQFCNVLQGRMSIVGPRPHAVAHNEAYRQIIKAYMVRHKVRPGITGWAQVNGHRGETDTLEKMRARVEFDLEYLRNWNLALDLQIIARTVRLLFADRHAY